MSTTAQLITGTDFVAVHTQDLERAIAFYGETLGLRCSVRREGMPYAEFETGNLTLSVLDAKGMGLEYNVNRSGIALHTDDVAAARATLEERGVAFAGDTFDTGVCHMAFFADPDGNALILHGRYRPRVTTG